ncbi:uncharacterized protein V1510DRAFT_414720 [Dipodascopsis tothii]|uniref:uncharacterized protein n=1 Tax=Dipodascopsis tothii TaxID=44089 RepID=UPI0034D01A69
MRPGVPAYGARVRADKSLASFALPAPAPPLHAGREFPYCGFTIDTRTLDVRRDLLRAAAVPVSAVVTVEYCRAPAAAFARAFTK